MVSDNELVDNETAIETDRSSAVLDGNLFCDNTIDLLVDGEATEVDPTVGEVCRTAAERRRKLR